MICSRPAFLTTGLSASSLLASSLFTASAYAETAAGTAVPSTAGNLFQVLLGLIVVLALMAGAAWLLRRFNTAKGISNTSIKVVGAASVGTRERVVVVEIADQWIVVGVAPGRVNALATMQKQETTLTPEAPSSGNFSTWLAQTIEKRNGQ
ncbi:MULTISPECIES: flagellar biosynthetic protein FliO [Oxalobacteraceae]|uniref:flagellar biosynthetic protein FliO n=1 Tax=Herminiimonas TaxID=303379 RepID=UPI001E5C9E04|nr:MULTISPECIES: flagellar biosynthetic protein FliO [Oxalobacteraceae]